MMTIRIAGDIHYALWHFALFGTAAILEQELGCTTRVEWLDADTAQVTMESAGADEETVAAALHQHAVRHVDSWVQHVHELPLGKKTAKVGTFSPRLPLPADADAWHGLQAARLGQLDILQSERDWLDLRFIHSLGEPAYWYFDQAGKARPDVGASGWEMKTRNRGEEFVQNRLALLANSVAARKPKQVLQGIQGDYFADETGRNATDSRTPTGLRPPSPTDNALAWAALWGISQFPVIHRAGSTHAYRQQQGSRSLTTGQLRGRNVPGLDRLRRSYTFLPVFGRPARLSTLKAVLVSSQLARTAAVEVRRRTAAAEPDPYGNADLGSPSDVSWLVNKGVTSMVVSVVTATDNPNAPEMSVQRGTLVVLST